MLSDSLTITDFFLSLDYPIPLVRLLAKAINPWDDSVIDDFNIHIYNAIRELTIRSRTYDAGFWDKLEPESKLMAEAESAYLIDHIHELRVLRLNYIHAELLPKDTEFEEFSVKHDQWLKFARQQIRTVDAQLAAAYNLYPDSEHFSDYDFMIRMTQYLVATLVLPVGSPTLEAEYDLLHKPVTELEVHSLLPTRMSPRSEYALTRYRERLHDVSNELWRGWTAMLASQYEQAELGKNELTGAMAHSHFLFTNRNIPLPTKASFVGWLQYSGIAFRKLDKHEIRNLTAFAGFQPSHILTYVAPLMPMTKEHLAHSLVTTDDSQSLFSLPAKSKGHKRDQLSNRIEYGLWRVKTVLLNGQDQIMPIAEQNITNMGDSLVSYHEQHIATLAGISSTIQNYHLGRQSLFLFEGINLEELSRMPSMLYDPYIAHPDRLDVMYPLRNAEVMFPWASLAKFYGMHYRFDDEDALTAWQSRFEEMACWAVRATAVERNREYLRFIIYMQHNIRVPISVVTKNGQRFDLTGL